MKKKSGEHLFDRTLREKLEDQQVNISGADKLWADFDKKYPPATPAGNGSPVNKWLPLLSLLLIVTISAILLTLTAPEPTVTNAHTKNLPAFDSLVAADDQNSSPIVASGQHAHERSHAKLNPEETPQSSENVSSLNRAEVTLRNTDKRTGSGKLSIDKAYQSGLQTNISELAFIQPKKPDSLRHAEKLPALRISTDSLSGVIKQKAKNVNIIW